VADRTDIMSTGWNGGTKGDVRFKPLAQARMQLAGSDICAMLSSPLTGGG